MIVAVSVLVRQAIRKAVEVGAMPLPLPLAVGTIEAVALIVIDVLI